MRTLHRPRSDRSLRTGSGRTPDGIHVPRIQAWFKENIADVQAPLSFERIPGGRSNLTYSVTDSAGSRWALRRPPLGRRLASAHDMVREYMILSALQVTSVPVPPLVGLCEDESVNGGPFYVMDWLAGPVLRSEADASVFRVQDRRAIGERVVDTLVEIHAVDPDEVGLRDLARKGAYVARQLRRWRSQWEESKRRELGLVEELHDRLSVRIPKQTPATIVHGDYRLDNLILTPAGEIAAVIDWELCTLGDPLADVGLLLVYWPEPGDELIPLSESATLAPGFPSRREICSHYAKRSGRDLSEVDFYVALGLWKLAIVLEGVFARFAAGQYGAFDLGEQGEEVVDRLLLAADDVERRRA